MAEFIGVVHTIQRICKRADGRCPVCILGEFACPNNVRFDKTDEAEFRELEDVVTKWAEENPEPVYPTWGEWLESEGICFSRLTNYEKVHGFTIPKVFEYKIDGKTAFICGDRVNSPIPADIAQKLGIEPKEDV